LISAQKHCAAVMMLLQRSLRRLQTLRRRSRLGTWYAIPASGPIHLIRTATLPLARPFSRYASASFATGNYLIDHRRLGHFRAHRDQRQVRAVPRTRRTRRATPTSGRRAPRPWREPRRAGSGRGSA
jgi:hypothetical protein